MCDEPDSADGRIRTGVGLLGNDNFHVQSVLYVLDSEPAFSYDQADLVVRNHHVQRGGRRIVQLLHLLLLIAEGHENLHLSRVHGFFCIAADAQRPHLTVIRYKNVPLYH